MTVQGCQKSKRMIFQMKRLKLLPLILVEKQLTVTFKVQKRSIMKNSIEKIIFSIIFSVENKLSMTFKGHLKGKMKISIEMFEALVIIIICM